jgi:DnaJ-class molecular chaperone
LENIAQIHPNHWSWLDPHARLGLPSNAPITDIKRQYRRLALLYHPDKARHHDALEMFHGIKSAYEMLTNTT